MARLNDSVTLNVIELYRFYFESILFSPWSNTACHAVDYFFILHFSLLIFSFGVAGRKEEKKITNMLMLGFGVS